MHPNDVIRHSSDRASSLRRSAARHAEIVTARKARSETHTARVGFRAAAAAALRAAAERLDPGRPEKAPAAQGPHPTSA